MDYRSSSQESVGGRVVSSQSRNASTSSGHGQSRPTIPASDISPYPPLAEAPSTQARTLQLRKARFRGLVVPSRNITPVKARRSSTEVESPEQQHVSPFEYGSLERRKRRTDSNDLGILQEISNSSLRRKRSQRQDISTIFQPPTALESSTFHTDEAELLPNIHSTQIPRIEVANTPRRRGPRAVSKDNLNNETTKYIEHLESQLAALHTQLQALTSPSTTRTHSAKLRAMNSESRLLKQEVSDWESKFHERVKEQLEQHEVVVGKLKSEIRQLEKQIEKDTGMVKELQTQSDERTRQLVVVESANYDLERRLEFMSELLASSSGRVDARSDNQSNASRRSGPAPRPRSVGPLRIPTPILQQFSVQHEHRPRRQDPSRTPEGRSPAHSGAEENPFERLNASTRSLETSPETASVVSEHTLVESLGMSPGSRRSVMLSQSVNSEHDSRTRPARRMRRFYTGSTGPRSLILPTTTHTGQFSTSTPILESPNPSMHTMMTPREGLGFKLPISPERPSMHKRANTWDEGRSASVRKRRIDAIEPITEAASPFSYRLPPPQEDEHDQTPPTPTFSPPQQTSQAATPTFSDDGSAQLMANRAISLSSVRGRNLFDELSRMKHDEDSEDPTGTTASRVSSSPFRSFSGPASYAVTPLATSRSPSPSPHLEPGPQISPPSVLTAGASSAANIAAKRSTSTTNPSQTLPSSQSVSSPSSSSGSTITRLLSLISHSLALPSVHAVVSNAWSMLSLSRPVLEFRFWLIRLLLGDLRKRHRHLLTLRDAAKETRDRNVSGMTVVPPGSHAGAVGLGISHGQSLGIVSRNVSRNTSAGRPHPAKLLDPFDDGAIELNVVRRRRKGVARDDAVGDDSNGDGPLTIEDLEASPTTTARSKLSAPVAWLKFSMTLVFAVGVAIKDGPASLLAPSERARGNE